MGKSKKDGFEFKTTEFEKVGLNFSIKCTRLDGELCTETEKKLKGCSRCVCCNPDGLSALLLLITRGLLMTIKLAVGLLCSSCHSL